MLSNYAALLHLPSEITPLLGGFQPSIKWAVPICRLMIQTTQEVGNLRWNRLFHKAAIHLPNMIADAYPDGTGYTSIRIISAYGPFRKRLGFPQIGRRPHGASSIGMPCPFRAQLWSAQNCSLKCRIPVCRPVSSRPSLIGAGIALMPHSPDEPLNCTALTPIQI